MRKRDEAELTTRYAEMFSAMGSAPRIEAFLALPLSELQGEPQRLKAELDRIRTLLPTFEGVSI